MRKVERFAKLALARFVARFLRVEKITPAELSSVAVERLLVIRQHNQMGDMLLAVPAFRGLRKRFPGARITLVASPINSRVMENNPYVDEVLTYAKRRSRRDPLELPRFIGELRRRRFDAAIVLNTVSFSVTSMLLAVASGARLRVGSTSAPFGHDLTSRFYHLELPLPSSEELARMHESEHNLYPLAAIGVRESDLASLLVPTEAERDEARRFIAAAFGPDAPFIACHPGAGKTRNIWPPERFAELVRLLGERRALAAVAVRGPMDRETMDAFLAASAKPPAVVSCPSVGFLGALMERASLVLCNDTGIMHIAGAVGARCVALFGPTDPARWKPVNGSVVAVRGANGEVASVTVAEALEAALRLIG
jgi:ADP-heptose:LPS heptosyltransferase